jgi:hypothetical protein
MSSTRLVTFASLLLAIVSSGCSTPGDTTASLCRMQPAQACTEDCTWDEVLHHDEHCAVCARPGGIGQYQGYEVADCGGYHLLKAAGGDAGSVRFYDAATGALVGEMSIGEPCLDGNVWPAGCENPAFQEYGAWCDPYRVDGRGTRCCLSPDRWEMALGRGKTNVCTWTPDTTAACGDYDVSIWPGTSGPDGVYYDAGTGDLMAVVETRLGQTACYAGPASGFTAPVCPSPPAAVDCPASAAAF